MKEYKIMSPDLYKLCVSSLWQIRWMWWYLHAKNWGEGTHVFVYSLSSYLRSEYVFYVSYENHSEIFHVHVLLADRNHLKLVTFSCINPLLCKTCIVRTGKPQLFADVFQWNELKMQIACVCRCVCLCVHSPSLESIAWPSFHFWSPFPFLPLSLQIPWFPDTRLFYFSLSLNILETQKCQH